MLQPISVEGDELSFGKPGPAQAVGVAGAVFRPPERRSHSFKIGQPQCGIELAQRAIASRASTILSDRA